MSDNMYDDLLKLRKINKNIDCLRKEMCRMLADVYEFCIYEQVGYVSFSDYFSFDLKIQERNALYMVQVGRFLKSCDKNGLKWIDDISWAILHQLLSISTKVNIKDFADFLIKANIDDINGFVHDVKQCADLDKYRDVRS